MTIQQMPTERPHESVVVPGRHKDIEADIFRESEALPGLDVLISRVLRLSEEEGLTLALAAVRVYLAATLDDDARDTLAVRGLASMAGDIAGRFNRLPDESAGKDDRAAFLGRFQLNTRHSPAALADVMQRVRLVGHDGLVRPLIDFSMDDVRSFRSRSDAQVEGWQRRVKLMAEYEAALTKHKAATGRDLPKVVLERIRKEAQKAWS